VMVWIVAVLFVVVGTVAYVALRNAQDFADANEIIPGVATSAPKAWAGAHSPEARLHRRLRDAMTALRSNRALDEPALAPVREALEREALAVDDRLVAAAALPKGARDEPIRRAGEAVEAIEQAVADVVALRGPGVPTTEQALDDVRLRLAAVEGARAELELLAGGGSATLDELRRAIAEEPAERADPDDGGATGGAPDPR